MADCRTLSGDRIRIARSLHRPKMTQEDLIAKLQVEHQIYFSRNTISRIETGERYITDCELLAIFKVLKVPILWLLRETDKLDNKLSPR